MTKLKCAVCGSDLVSNFQERDAKSGEYLSLARCHRCGLVQQMPLPSLADLEIYYSHNYRTDYKSVYEPAPKYICRAGRVALERLSWIIPCSESATDKSLFDVGAGGGEFVYLAAKSGYTASGIEPNIGYSDFARRAYGVDVSTGMLGEKEVGRFDVVTMFHVLEHMHNPFAVSEKVAGLLKPGGLLAVEVPNILQLDASPSNIFFKAHLMYFSPETLRMVFSAHFDEIYSETTGNLKFVFRVKPSFRESITLPAIELVQSEKSMFLSKSWMTYLLEGRGCMKAFKNLFRRLHESRFRKCDPKKILDMVYQSG